jgi:mono/diheme cytochrome c family protein
LSGLGDSISSSPCRGWPGRCLAALMLLCLIGSERCVVADAHAASGTGTTPGTSVPGGYTAEQSERGKRLFETACRSCHVLDESLAAPVSLRGVSMRSRWNNAKDLFGKVNSTMPGNKVASLSTADCLDVIAYLMAVNGGKAGSVPLTATGSQLEAVRFEVRAPVRSTAAHIDSRAYFSEPQAQRGAGFFAGSCSLCHLVGRSGPARAADGPPESLVPVVAPQGLALGSSRFEFNLAGADFIGRYPTVADLYLKIATTMPGYAAHGLSPQTYLDITAFLLRENGLPAGGDELTADMEALHAMPLLEPGFQLLFNGKDLAGWHVLLGHNCTPPPSGCGSADPGSTFRAVRRVLTVSGQPLGYLYTDKKYLNFVLRMDFRFLPYDGVAADEPFFGNSGWMLFIQEHQVWPKMIEIQGMQPRLLDVLPIDSHAKFSVDAAARERALRPLRWNSVEIVSKDGRVESSLNGILVSVITEHEFKAPGYLGLESEGAQIMFRNIRIKEL